MRTLFVLRRMHDDVCTFVCDRQAAVPPAADFETTDGYIIYMVYTKVRMGRKEGRRERARACVRQNEPGLPALHCTHLLRSAIRTRPWASSHPSLTPGCLSPGHKGSAPFRARRHRRVVHVTTPQHDAELSGPAPRVAPCVACVWMGQ